MLVSLKWLREYVDFRVSPEELAERLTMAGLEVEAVYRPTGVMDDVLVGRVERVAPHPDADRLSLAIVDTGKDRVQVVCGAPNLAEGGLYPLALPGVELPGGRVKDVKLRGEPSHGMLLSERDLGISDDHSGLMELSPDSAPGAALTEVLGQDTVFEIGVTPNRPDCLSILGIAREAAVLTGRPVNYPEVALEESERPIEEDADVIVHDGNLCPRYAARLIRGLKIGPSPGWLVERLESFDQEPINNVVDVTNFVMLEYGQPLHAFDFNRLAKHRIEVRTAGEGEAFTTLDGKEHLLTEGMLLICDGERPVALAGIMGGLNSEITDDTVDVLIESAYFDPVSIRKTSKSLGISTESSYRFERGVDPQGVIPALDRAAQLMVEVAGGELSRGAIDRLYDIPRPQEVKITVGHASSFLGVELAEREVVEVLEGLGMEVKKEGDGLVLLPPGHRLDIAGPEDVFEEIARIIGYHRVPSELPSAPMSLPGKDPFSEFRERARQAMVSMGFFETITYSFVSPKALASLGLAPDDPRSSTVRLMNPITEDQEVMRTTQAVGLLQAAAYNLRHKNEDLRIFELGSVFLPESGEELPAEWNALCCVMCGRRSEPGWYDVDKQVDFYDIKGVAEALARGMGVEGLRFAARDTEPFLKPGASCGIYVGEEPAGYAGEVLGEVLESFGIKTPLFLMELRIMDLYASRSPAYYRPLPRFPAVMRDVALVLDETVSAQTVLTTLREALERVLKSTDVGLFGMDIFDVYRGSQLEPGLKSLGVRLSFRGVRSLTDEEVNTYLMEALESALPALGARLRE